MPDAVATAPRPTLGGRARSLRNVPAGLRWGFLFASLAGLVVWHAWASQFNHDEIEHLHAAWLVGRGETPFTDFLEQHHPTLWYLLAPWTRAIHGVRGLVFAARSLDLACLAFVLLAFVRMVRRIYPGASARWPALLLIASFIFTRCMMEVRPDPLMNALVYAGLLSWVAFLQDGGCRRALAAGLSFGAAAAVLQKALVVFGLVVAATVLLAILHRRDRRSRDRLGAGLAVTVAGAAVPLCAFVSFIAARGYWRDFWFWNYEFNRFFYLQAALSKHFSVWVTLGVNVAVDPVLWAAGGAGMVLCARERWRARPRSAAGDARLALLLVALGYVPYLCLNRFPLEQYYIVLLPLLALFSTEAFARASVGRLRNALERGAVFMAIVLGCILVFHPGNREQRELQEFVLSQTAADEPVFLPPPHNPVFRPHSGYFWYNATLIGDAYVQYCRVHPACAPTLALDDELWRRRPPAFVLLGEPEYFPFRWGERAGGYEATAVPRLLRASPAHPAARD